MVVLGTGAEGDPDPDLDLGVKDLGPGPEKGPADHRHLREEANVVLAAAPVPQSGLPHDPGLGRCGLVELAVL